MLKDAFWSPQRAASSSAQSPHSAFQQRPRAGDADAAQGMLHTRAQHPAQLRPAIITSGLVGYEAGSPGQPRSRPGSPVRTGTTIRKRSVSFEDQQPTQFLQKSLDAAVQSATQDASRQQADLAAARQEADQLRHALRDAQQLAQRQADELAVAAQRAEQQAADAAAFRQLQEQHEDDLSAVQQKLQRQRADLQAATLERQRLKEQAQAATLERQRLEEQTQATALERQRLEDEHAAAQQQWQQGAIAKLNELGELRQQLADLRGDEEAATGGRRDSSGARRRDSDEASIAAMEDELSHLRMNSALLKAEAAFAVSQREKLEVAVQQLQQQLDRGAAARATLEQQLAEAQEAAQAQLPSPQPGTTATAASQGASAHTTSAHTVPAAESAPPQADQIGNSQATSLTTAVSRDGTLQTGMFKDGRAPAQPAAQGAAEHTPSGAGSMAASGTGSMAELEALRGENAALGRQMEQLRAAAAAGAAAAGLRRDELIAAAGMDSPQRPGSLASGSSASDKKQVAKLRAQLAALVAASQAHVAGQDAEAAHHRAALAQLHTRLIASQADHTAARQQCEAAAATIDKLIAENEQLSEQLNRQRHSGGGEQSCGFPATPIEQDRLRLAGGMQLSQAQLQLLALAEELDRVNRQLAAERAARAELRRRALRALAAGDPAVAAAGRLADEALLGPHFDRDGAALPDEASGPGPAPGLGPTADAARSTSADAACHSSALDTPGRVSPRAPAASARQGLGQMPGTGTVSAPSTTGGGAALADASGKHSNGVHNGGQPVTSDGDSFHVGGDSAHVNGSAKPLGAGAAASTGLDAKASSPLALPPPPNGNEAQPVQQSVAKPKPRGFWAYITGADRVS